jgi:L-threonylcarbamoyladenylate synthase
MRDDVQIAGDTMATPATSSIINHQSSMTHHSSSLIHQASNILHAGGVVAMPTETVYGLACDALNEKAAARVFEIKGRPRFDPLIVHAADVQQARSLVSHWPEWAHELAERFWPGPLTLVLPRADHVPDIVTAGLDTVALRVPNHAMALELIRAAGSPLAAPSANRFGAISPTTAEHVRADLGSDVDLILDGGPCGTGVESTIVTIDAQGPLLLRPGGTPAELIEAVVGKLRLASDNDKRPAAPGMLPRHYAPRTPMTLVGDVSVIDPEFARGAGLLTLRPVDAAIAARFAACVTLSDTGDLRVAAAALFAAMRNLDAMNLPRLFATSVPEQGLGLAINDRLRRAASDKRDH